MNIKLYIGTELADFNEVFNVMFSIGDIREISFGNSNKSYTLNLPLTKQNKRLLSFITQTDVKTEQSATGRLYIGEQLIISGLVIVSSYNEYYAKVIISSDDWIDALKDLKMTALDLSASDHSLTNANVEGSWTASYPMYRYPMIDFGGLQSGEVGTYAKWFPTDFIPMVSVAQLMAKILEPYTISSSWIATSFVKDLFVVCREQIANNEFTQNKQLNVAVQASGDNTNSGTSSTVMMVELAKNLVFNTITTDQGNDWTTYNTYTVPVTGTYRFEGSVTLVNTADGNASLTITDEQVVIEIRQNGSSIKQVASAAYVATELINAVTYTIDSGYVHLEAGDAITLNLLARCYVTINAGSQTVTINTGIATTFENVWGNANRYPGLNKNISLEEMLPDMTQVDFLAAIRDIFNLRFWMDKQNRTIYIEPWDSFLSSTVVDLDEYIDYENIDSELISNNYNEKIVLKWKDDTSDKAYEEYLKENVSGPDSKEITLTSLYAKKGIDYREHPFSSVIMGYNHSTYNGTYAAQIWNEIPVYPFTTFDRKVGFNTRIVSWKGLTSTYNWNFDGTNKASYPKIEGIDFTDMYSDYWQKLFHYIDKGKVLTVRMKVNPLFLNQFYAVVGTATSQGFRPTYSITINGIKNYFFLQRVTSDGTIAELEMVLKQ
jgi:hypothetical protein